MILEPNELIANSAALMESSLYFPALIGRRPVSP